MDHNGKTAIERALELAKSGWISTSDELLQVLKSEGYYVDSIVGPMLFRQLRILIRDARGTAPAS